MSYTQIIDDCFGANMLEKPVYEKVLTEAEKILSEVLQEVKNDDLPIIGLCETNNGLDEIEEFAGDIKANFNNLIVLGTGGSTLCPQALTGLMEGDQVIFMDNIDPQTWDDLFKKINLNETAFLAISKSGTTIETIAQTLVCLEKAQNINISKHFFAITMPDEASPNNHLRNLAEHYKFKTYEHDPNVGGRFSIFSLVGLMPAVFAGLDAKALRAGGKEFLANHTKLAAISASLHVGFMRKNIWQNVMMTYPDKLERLNHWYRQIWAESVGKNGTGSTPIKSTGTLDQHSQMQLYLGGRKDKFYNFIVQKTKGQGAKISDTVIDELELLKGKKIGDLFNAEQAATIQTLAEQGRPVRVIEIEEVSEKTLGMLIMHLMLETIITAKLLGVNPYDQPAVEAGKQRTRELVKES